MRHDLGRSSFVLVWVEYTTLKGPCLLGASFAFGCVVCMFVTGAGHETQSRAYTGAKLLRDKRILADASPTCVTEVRIGRRRLFIVPKDRRDSTWSLRDSK